MGYIKKTDFKGNIKISQNTKETNDLQLYIERNTKNILIDFIGDYQYNLFINQLDNFGLSNELKYKQLITGIDLNDNNVYYYDKDDTYTSYFGILSSIRYFIFWDYVRNLNSKATSVGIRFAEAENSNGSTQLQVNNVIEQRYNLGVENYCDAQNLLINLDDAKLHYKDIIDNLDDTYTINIEQINGKNSLNLCGFLAVNDYIELDNMDYKISAIDMSDPLMALITFEASTGKTFEEKYFHINPFLDYVSKRKMLSVLDGMF